MAAARVLVYCVKAAILCTVSPCAHAGTLYSTTSRLYRAADCLLAIQQQLSANFMCSADVKTIAFYTQCTCVLVHRNHSACAYHSDLCGSPRVSNLPVCCAHVQTAGAS
eukprot:19496-Heterococcus_DN1.PRE.2